MVLLRLLSVSLLSLALIAGALVHGHMGLQPRAVGTIELCVGLDSITVAVDSRGQPVEHDAPIHCDDCLPAMTALAATPQGWLQDGALTLSSVVWAQGAALVAAAETPHVPGARAPPLAI